MPSFVCSKTFYIPSPLRGSHSIITFPCLLLSTTRVLLLSSRNSGMITLKLTMQVSPKTVYWGMAFTPRGGKVPVEKDRIPEDVSFFRNNLVVDTEVKVWWKGGALLVVEAVVDSVAKDLFNSVVAVFMSLPVVALLQLVALVKPLKTSLFALLLSLIVAIVVVLFRYLQTNQIKKMPHEDAVCVRVVSNTIHPVSESS